MLQRHSSDVCEPYEFEKENATTGEIEIIKKLSDAVSSDRSLLKLVKTFLQQTKRSGDDPILTQGGDDGTQVVIDEDEDQNDDDDEEIETVSEGESGEGAMEQLNSELQAQ